MTNVCVGCSISYFSRPYYIYYLRCEYKSLRQYENIKEANFSSYMLFIRFISVTNNVLCVLNLHLFCHSNWNLKRIIR